MASDEAPNGAVRPIVLVGVDGSSASDSALLWAADEAFRTKAVLRVVLVRAHPSLVNRRNIDDARHSRKLLTELVEKTLLPDRIPEYQVEVMEGNAPEALLSEARATNAALLILGRRGRGGFESLLLGSVSDQCARHSTCPVMVVPAASYDTSPRGTIVVGVDGSAASERALDWAADQAGLFGCDLRIVGAWNPPILPADSIASDIVVLHQGLDSYADQARAAVDGSLSRCQKAHPELPVRTEVVQGDPTVVLTKIANGLRARMLVLGTRGRGGFRALLLGSVADKTLHHALTPVVVVPQMPG